MSKPKKMEIFQGDFFDLSPVCHNPGIYDWVEEKLRFGTFTYDSENDSIWWSKGVFDIYGLPYTTKVTRNFEAFFTAEGRMTLDRCYQEAIEEGKSWSEILKIYPQFGEPIWVRSRGWPSVIDGRVVVSGSIQEITAQIEQTEFIENLVEQIPSHVISTDVTGEIIFTNEHDIFGSGEELIGRNILDIYEQSYRETVRNCMSSSKKSELPLVVESEKIDPESGESIFIYSVVTPVFVRGEFRGYIFVSHDITEKVEQQREIDKQQAIASQNAKLASIGELAAGVGHEINNPLEIISAHIQRLQRQLQMADVGKDEISSALTKVGEAISRISEIVGGLRTFSRADDEGLEPVCLNQVVHNTTAFVKELFAKEEVIISLKLSTKDLCVEANIGKLQQVLLNLLNNSKDAMKNSLHRRIIITTGSSGLNASLSVEDSGVGVDPVIRDNLFKAFFTTKPVNNGTGMGLYISNSIVQRFAGRIEVSDSEIGGAKFTVHLPISEKKSNQNPSNQKILHQPKFMQNYSILLVDDEEGIREILSESLADYGHTVVTARNGLEGYKLLKTQKFDIVVSDIKMPRMDGLTFFSKARELRLNPFPMLVIMTGANENPVATVADHVFLKPFAVSELLEKIHDHFKTQKAG